MWPKLLGVKNVAKIISTDSFISLNGRCATSRYLQVVGSIHDIESYFGIDNTLSLNLQIFTAHWGHLTIILIWVSGNLYHIASNANYSLWVKNPIPSIPIAHNIWDPHFTNSSHWNSSWTFLNSTHRTSSRHHNTSLSSSTNSYLTLLLNILWWFKIEYNFIVPYRYCTSSLSNWYHIHPYRSSILLFQGSPWNIYTRYIIYIHQATQHKITTLSPLTHSSQLYSTYIYHHSAHLFFNTILLFVL